MASEAPLLLRIRVVTIVQYKWSHDRITGLGLYTFGKVINCTYFQLFGVGKSGVSASRVIKCDGCDVYRAEQKRSYKQTCN